MPSRKKNARQFLAMWDILGLECIIDITEFMEKYTQWEKEKVWQTLQEQKVSTQAPNIPLQQMILRARFNSQRHYEIYEFNSFLSKEELQEVFENDPQPLVDWIRDNGYKVFSERQKCSQQKIY